MSKKNHSDEEKKSAGSRGDDGKKADQDISAKTPGVESTAVPDQKNGLSPEDMAKQRIAELEMELAANKDKLLRAHADFDNFRKRTYKDMTEARTFVKIDTIQPILNVFDHFNLALQASERKPDFKVLDDGMKMILVEFKKAMDELSIDIIQVSEGQIFDPALHEAASKEPSDKHGEGRILRQWRQGYKMGERILRPASVVVSSGPAQPAANASDVKESK
ncbi:MAG TPA: nucleotide exchange factor GrpE [Lentisphaeria bacterium]|nr:MAG: nucleotide exchange factor GrpE [Lentisphaerae bacterium GWF2_50_93]HCE43704.1 nucleotide exchange factor GrpE [Lentisphaeria bacterium]